jgi:hypothetical protein
MNYTTITINGEKVGLKFGMYSFRYLSEGRFVEGLSFANNQLTEIGIAHILYSGYINNCVVKDTKDPKYTFEDFVDFIEKNIQNEEVLIEVKKILEVWAASEFIKGKKTDTAKKKTTRGKK